MDSLIDNLVEEKWKETTSASRGDGKHAYNTISGVYFIYIITSVMVSAVSSSEIKLY